MAPYNSNNAVCLHTVLSIKLRIYLGFSLENSTWSINLL